MPLQGAFAVTGQPRILANSAASSSVCVKLSEAAKTPSCLIPEMQDHERGVELNRERCRERRHFDADRLDIVADLDREGRASDPKIPRELAHPCFYGIRRHDQVIDQGPGTERRDPGEFEREIWREAFLATPVSARRHRRHMGPARQDW